MPTIDLEILMIGKTLGKDATVLDHVFLDKEHLKMSNQLAGLLCTNHVRLPTVQKAFVDDRWVIRIHGCCVNHLDLIEKRLDENYKDHKK